MAPTDPVRFVSASSIDLLYDDSTDIDKVLTFSQSGSQTWTVFPDLQWQGGTATVLGGEATVGSKDEVLTVSYRGSGVSLYGLAPSAAEGQRFRVSVNDQKPVEVTFGGTWNTSSSAPSSSDSSTPSSSSNSTTPFSYGMWYNLETPETALTRVGTIIKFYDLPPGLSIDYAKIIGNEGSPLITVPVMADDSDKQITYSGSWTETQEPFTLAGKSQVASASAYGGGVHVGRQVGDTVELRFQGNAIKVFGLILPGGSSGEGMTVSYTVDSMSPQVMRYGSSFAGSSSTSNSSSSPLSSSSSSSSVGGSPLDLGMVSMQNYELFSSGTIAGDVFHSLLINITSVPSSSNEPQQALVIDYFTYEPTKRGYVELARFASGMAYNSKSTTPRLIWVLVAVFVALGVALVLGSGLRILMRRRPEMVRRLAQTVRLDLEFTFNSARKFLRSTVLDIRPQTPPPAPLPGDNPNPSQPSRSASTPGSSSSQNPNATPEHHQAQVQELWSIIAYLSRINTRLMSSVGRAPPTANSTSSTPQGAQQGTSSSGWGLSSFGTQSQSQLGRWQSVWGTRSRGGSDEPPPPYRV